MWLHSEQPFLGTYDRAKDGARARDINILQRLWFVAVWYSSCSTRSIDHIFGWCLPSESAEQAAFYRIYDPILIAAAVLQSPFFLMTQELQYWMSRLLKIIYICLSIFSNCFPATIEVFARVLISKPSLTMRLITSCRIAVSSWYDQIIGLGRY